MHAGLFFLESSIPHTRVDGKCHRVIFLWFCPVGRQALWLSSGLPFWKVLQLRAAVPSSALSFSNVREQNQGMEGDIQRSLICVWTGALHINWSILSLIAKGLILGSHYDLEVTGWWWGLRGRTAATTRQWPLGSILMMAWWMTLELFEQQSSPESLQVLDRGITGTIGEGDLKPLIKLAKACESYLAISNSVYHGNKGVRLAISNSEAVAAPLPEAHLLQELWNLCSWFFFVPDFNLWWQHSALQTLVNILEKPQSLTILKLTPSLVAGIGILNLQQSAIKALEKISKRWPKDVANAGGRSELAKVIVQDDPQPSHTLWESAALVLSNVLTSNAKYYFKVPLRMTEAGAVDALLHLLRSHHCEEACGRLLEALFNNITVREMKVATGTEVCLMLLFSDAPPFSVGLWEVKKMDF
ncbi:hypothetical protein SAY86_021828 [Trapa natans]|uniref:Uncharacterized protein n=1 Tax=Trapa natans TaxID=22666 RepID=A0AAN7MD87_TRANT|nr:hypothetical protein SAY86_021828 [Trapa natans]